MSEWFRDGRVDVTNGSTTVAAASGWANLFDLAGIRDGDIFLLNESERFYEITDYTDNDITLRHAYAGTTATDQEYIIIRNQTATTNADLAEKIYELLDRVRSIQLSEANIWFTTAPGDPPAIPSGADQTKYFKLVQDLGSDVYREYIYRP